MDEANAFLERSRRQFLRSVALIFLSVVGLLLVAGAIGMLVAPTAGVTVFTVLTLIPALGAGLTLALIRQRPLWQAALPMVAGLILADLTVPFLLPEAATVAASSLSIPVLVFSLAGHRRLTLGLAIFGALAAVAIILTPPPADTTITLGAALPLLVALIVGSMVIVVWALADRLIASQNTALAIAGQRAAEAEAARVEAEAARAEVERLQQSEQQRLLSLVQSLELPVISVGQNILTVPLVGDLDSRRAASIQKRLLEEVTRQRAEVVVLDVTGITLLDTAVAQSLIETARAVQLLGARTFMSGMRAEVAHTLVGLNVDLSDIHSVANLGEALELVRSRQ